MYFWDMEAIELDPSFEDFCVWLWDLQLLFVGGFMLRSSNVRRERQARNHATESVLSKRIFYILDTLLLT